MNKTSHLIFKKKLVCFHTLPAAKASAPKAPAGKKVPAEEKLRDHPGKVFVDQSKHHAAENGRSTRRLPGVKICCEVSNQPCIREPLTILGKRKRAKR